MKLYRYRTQDHGSTHVRSRLDKYPVAFETDKGYWVPRNTRISAYLVQEWRAEKNPAWRKYARWVSKTGRKRFAYPTHGEAWASYQARCARRVELLRLELHEAEAARRLSGPSDVQPVEGRECLLGDWV